MADKDPWDELDARYAKVISAEQSRGGDELRVNAGAQTDKWDELDARYSAPQASTAPSKPVQAAPPIDYLEGYSWPKRVAIGAGKATSDFLNNFGLGVDGTPEADAAIDHDTAGLVGNGIAQAGMMYVGGQALRGAGAGIKALQAGPTIGRATQAVGSGLEWLGTGAVNPASYKQAAAAGGAFGAVSKPGEIGDRLANAGIGSIGGMGGLALGRGMQKVAGAVKNLLPSAEPIESQITAKLTANGIDLHALPRGIQEQIIATGKKSLGALDNLNPDELARMADFKALNIQPTKGWVTRDPSAWWEENTLNTVNKDIATRFRDANQSLLQGVRTGAPDATDYQLGRKLSDTITGHDAAMKSKADALYQAARDMSGRDIPLDPHRFVNEASTSLDQQMLGSKLPGDTLSWFQKITTGKEPFDMGTAMQRLQAINGRIYSTTDPAEAKALGMVKTHLINALDDYGSQGGGLIGGQQAEQVGLSQAFRAARTAAAERFKFQDSNPIVDKVLSGKYTPEQFPDIVGRMRTDDLASLAKIQSDHGIPVMSAAQDAARAFIRDSSTLQGETGGSFTINGMRKALDKIGPEKGRMLFGADGWESYQQILRTAGNINNAPLKPAGSTTASNALRVLQKIPLGGKALGLTVDLAGKAHQMVKVNGLLNPQATMPAVAGGSSRIAPLTAGGLLGFTASDAAAEQPPLRITRGR